MTPHASGTRDTRPSLAELRRKAWEVRRDILIMLAAAGSGHPGGSLSEVEILLALYYYKLRHDPQDPSWEERDKLVLSKGHACPGLYTVLAHRGFFPREELLTFRKLGSRLQGHAYLGVPGVEASTGSLGQGLSIANGLALPSWTKPTEGSSPTKRAHPGSRKGGVSYGKPSKNQRRDHLPDF